MEEKIRCKFTCNSVEKTKGWNGGPDFLFKAHLTPVHDGSDENKEFWAATPEGSIEVATVALDVFEPGKEYYVDFTPA